MPTGSPLLGLSRVRVPSGSLATQIASEAAATRSGAAAIGIGSEAWTLLPPPSKATASTTMATVTATPAPAHCSRLPPKDPKLGRARIGSVGRCADSESTCVAASPAPSRSRAAAIRAPALG